MSEAPSRPQGPPTSRARALFQVSVFSAAGYATEVFYLIRGLALARLLGPAEFGVWSSMRLTRDLALYSHLGAFDGLLQLAPRAAGSGDANRVRNLGSAASALALTTALVVLVGLAACVLAGVWRFGDSHQTAWMILAGVLLIGQVQRLYGTYLRTQHRFELVSGTMLGIAAGSTILGVPAAARWGLDGFVTALGASIFLVGSVVIWLGPAFPRPRFDIAEIRQLIGTGFPIVSANVVHHLLATIDKLLLWILASSAALGVYALPTYITGGLMLLPFAAASVTYPRLLDELGRNDRASSAWPYLERAGVWLGHVTCPALAAIYLSLHLPIGWWLPDYADAIAPGRILVLAAFFPIVSHMPAMILIALGAPGRVILSRGMGLAVAGAIIAGVLTRGEDLGAVAMGAACGQAVQALSVWLLAAAFSELPARRRVSIGVGLALPYMAMLAALAAVGAPPKTTGSMWTDLVAVVPTILAVSGALGAWAIFSAKRLGFLDWGERSGPA